MKYLFIDLTQYHIIVCLHDLARITLCIHQSLVLLSVKLFLLGNPSPQLRSASSRRAHDHQLQLTVDYINNSSMMAAEEHVSEDTAFTSIELDETADASEENNEAVSIYQSIHYGQSFATIRSGADSCFSSRQKCSQRYKSSNSSRVWQDPQS